MKNFIGIDLGTTNSTICSYDGFETRIWKSPEQNDVTPSAIYMDQRGNKYIGKRAYDAAPQNPDNSATLFKRLMGTSTPIQFSAAGLTLTPEECSAEVLKVLVGYLPEEIRNTPDTEIVITVPAAFNQMQKDATMQAATIAGLGKVALMQEPVAAVMSAMRQSEIDGMFLIYDLGGGTLDISIAQSSGGNVSLLALGGIAMCGGRDFDRTLLNTLVRPWLSKNFELPEDFSANPKYKSLIQLAGWATERAKIELSAREEAVISLSENETRVSDLKGKEIYLDIPLKRDVYTTLIDQRINETIEAARETLTKAGISPHDLDRVVFVGGPTNYKPLRDKVAFELGVNGNIEINPMTAVALGAGIFAESIDWSSVNRSRKESRGEIASSEELSLSFIYLARTSRSKAKIVIHMGKKDVSGIEFQLDSTDTGWTSGRLTLKHGASIEVMLTKDGDNTFKVSAFDSVGATIGLEQDRIVITRTAATVDAIPASHSISVEVLEKLDGRPALDYLIRAGDALPKNGKKIFKASEPLKAGSTGSLNLKIWEGEIEDPVADNRPVGVMKIKGTDFDAGIIHAGADLECTYEIQDSGLIILNISVPCIHATFPSEKNFYFRQAGQLDYTKAAAMVIDEGERAMSRINEISSVVVNPKLDQASLKLESAISLDPDETETETSQEAMEKIFEARKLIAQVRKEHLTEIRQFDLDAAISAFNEVARQPATASEEMAFDNKVTAAQSAINRKNNDFEAHIDDLQRMIVEILWRQDWIVIQQFKGFIATPHRFTNRRAFDELIALGNDHIRAEEIDKLRFVITQLLEIRIDDAPDNEFFDITNIIRE